MNENPLISICCVSYNHEKFITKCIESIWNQDYKNIEIIVVDDGSSDNSLAILEKLKLTSPFPMTVLPQKNTGIIGNNFNRALKHAKGRYVALISCDDYYYSDMASSQIEIFKKNQNIILIICSQITGVDEFNIINNQLLPPLKIREISNPQINDLLDLEFKLESSFYLQGSILRKDAVDAVGCFDQDTTGDDIILRTKLFLYIKNNPEYDFKIIDNPCCYYRIHDNNIHKNSIRQMKIFSEYLEKYWPKKKPPKIFYQSLKHTIRNNSLKEIFKLFNDNKTLRNSFFKIKILKCILRKIMDLK